MAKGKSTKWQTKTPRHTHKTKDRVTRTSLKTEGELKNDRVYTLIVSKYECCYVIW